MKLYTYPGAPNPRRVHIYLAEKGLTLPFERVDIMTRANRTPEFLANVNPLGGIPVLELDDGTHIAESVAICRYFEALHPEPSLFGKTPKQIGLVDMWIRRIELGIGTSALLVWMHGSPLTKPLVKHQIAEAAEQSRGAVRGAFDFLDATLSRSRFLAGSEFSMADIVALTILDFAARRLELSAEPRHAGLERWHAEVSARPSAKA